MIDTLTTSGYSYPPQLDPAVCTDDAAGEPAHLTRSELTVRVGALKTQFDGLTEIVAHQQRDSKIIADIQAEIAEALAKIGERLARLEDPDAVGRIPVAGTVGRAATPDAQAREDATINDTVTEIRAENAQG